MKHKLIHRIAACICAVFLVPPFALSQPYSVSGFIESAESGDLLPFALIVDTTTKQGTLSNSKGYFYIQLPAKTTLKVSLAGYETLFLDLCLRSDSVFNIIIQESGNNHDTIHIETSIGGSSTAINTVKLSYKQIRQMPMLGGEADAIKILQFTPGVQAGLEGTTGLNVRGGSPDQNLILLDGMPIYNLSHLLGYVSIFPVEAIRSVELLKSDFPAQYGGRLSSVIEIHTREGNLKQWQGGVAMSPIAIQSSVDGPVVKDRLSILLTARRSLLDLFISPFTRAAYQRQSIKGSLNYYFYDLSGKINLVVSPKSRIGISAYVGSDLGKIQLSQHKKDISIYDNNNTIRWGNTAISVRFQHQFSRNSFFQYTMGYTSYLHQTLSKFVQYKDLRKDSVEVEQARMVDSNIKELLFQPQIEVRRGNHIRFISGLQLSLRNVLPYRTSSYSFFQGIANDTVESALLGPMALNFSGFTGISWSITSRASVYAGIRGEYYYHKPYMSKNLQPRISANYIFSSSSTATISYNRMVQYVHMLSSNSLGGLPADIWISAQESLPAEFSDQFSISYTGKSDYLTWLIEVYYKRMNGVLEYIDGAYIYQAASTFDAAIAIGKGDSYGTELFLQYQKKHIEGRLSYTLSWSNRYFDKINGGNPFPFRYDRRHNLSLFASINLRNTQRRISLTWTYTSGAYATIPTQKYEVPNEIREDLVATAGELLSITAYQTGNWAFVSSGRNNQRIKPFHKLDIGYTGIPRKRTCYTSTFSAGIYNAYARKNPYFLAYNESRYRDPITLELRRYTGIQAYSLLVWIPFVSYSATF